MTEEDYPKEVTKDNIQLLSEKAEKKNDFQSVVYLGIVMFGVVFLAGGIVANGNLAWGISQYSTSLIIAGIILIVIGLILLAIKDFEVLRNLSQNDWPETPPP